MSNDIIQLVVDGKADEAVKLIESSGWVHPFGEIPDEVETTDQVDVFTVQSLKAGDIVHAYVKGQSMRTVANVHRKVKYVHVEFEDGGKAQFEVDTNMSVTRKVKDQAQVRLQSIEFELLGLIRTACKARAAAVEATQSVDVDNWLYHKLEAAAGTTIEWHMWSKVLAHTGPDMTFLEALAYTARTFEEDLLEDRLRGSSTNQWSNVYEAKQREKYSNFIRKGYGTGWSSVRYSLGMYFGLGGYASTNQLLDKLSELHTDQ